MKRLSYILLLMLVCGLWSCTPRELEYPGLEGVPAKLVRELGLDEPEMPVRIGFDLPGESAARPATKASVVGGEEDTNNYIQEECLVLCNE